MALTFIDIVADEGTGTVQTCSESSGRSCLVAKNKNLVYGFREGVLYVENSNKGNFNAAVFAFPETAAATTGRVMKQTVGLATWHQFRDRVPEKVTMVGLVELICARSGYTEYGLPIATDGF